MKIVKYPDDINKKEFLDNYSSKVLQCLKAGITSSYDFDISDKTDESWFFYLGKNLDQGVKYILLEEKNIVRGYLVWEKHDDEIHFYDLVIHPDYQRDISTLRKLLRLFAKDISEVDASLLWAYTNDKNIRMNAILKKHGFTVRNKKVRGTEYIIEIDRFLAKFK